MAVILVLFYDSPYPLLALLLPVGIFAVNSPVFRAEDYASLVGTMDTRTWTQDVQPASPDHIRLIPPETAMQIARQQLNSGTGSVGSQFEINEAAMHSQSVNGRLWWIVPLDFRSFSSWTATDGAPGYVMVSAEDPNAPAQFVQSVRLRYSPSAYFSKNLKRHLWNSGHRHTWLSDAILEIDEERRPWWVVAVSRPTIGWSGDVVQGAIIVNPETGSQQYYPIARIPRWVDRVIPEKVVRENLENYGLYTSGFWNRIWGGNNLTAPAGDESLFQYALGDEPYWVTQITSTNENDTTMLELVYTNARTNVSHRYRVRGGTEKAILDRLNNAVAYQHFHATNPVFYNIHGHMTAVVPIAGEAHTFQEVGLVSVQEPTLQIARATTFRAALRQYEQLLAQAGSGTMRADANRQLTTVTAAVRRIGLLSGGQDVTYAFMLEGNPHAVFTVSTSLSPLIALTEPGDDVQVRYTPSTETTVTPASFSNVRLEGLHP